MDFFFLMTWTGTPCGTIISIFVLFLLLMFLLPIRIIAVLCRQSKNLMQHRHEVFAVIGCNIEGEAGRGAGTCFVPYILPLPRSQSPNLSWWISGFDATRFSMFFGEPIFGLFSNYILLVLGHPWEGAFLQCHTTPPISNLGNPLMAFDGWYREL